MKRILFCCVLLAGFGARGAESPPVNDRLRVIIETDAGGDPDDEQSLVRFLLYANEWEVEGIIANRAEARQGENLNRERTGLGIVRAQLRAYGKCYAHLVQNDPRYPTLTQLWERTVPGYADTEAGVDGIIHAVDKDDPRPIWFCNWGTDHGSAHSSLWRALDRVQRERGDEGYARFKSRLRLSSADAFGPHTAERKPPWPIWVDTFRPPVDGKRWYHRFSALTAKAGGFNVERDVRTGHGPLGALYPLNTTHPQKEGDTMTFLYLVPNGLGDPMHPDWGSWAGRYGLNANDPGCRYYWANQEDAWHGATNRDNTLARWAADLQNDFRARLDWCVRDFKLANHPPQPALAGPDRFHVKAGETIDLDAAGSRDPDGDQLEYEWIFYPEPGTYHERPLNIRGERQAHAQCAAPRVNRAVMLHFILSVRDDGEPSLVRYRRVIVTVEPE